MKIFLILLLLIFCLVNYGLTKNENNDKYTKSGIVAVDTSKIAILPYDKTQGWLFRNCNPADLTSKDIQEIEIILTKCMDEYNSTKEKAFLEISTKNPELKLDKNYYVIDFKRYKRQYIAVINKRGEKEIWINCFCSSWDKNWKTEKVQVKDGGNCFFNLKINLTTGKYYDFMVNGVA